MARKKANKTVRAPLQQPSAAVAGAPAQARPGWIISPLWDSFLFIGAPLVVIAVFLPLRGVMSSEQIAILSLAFFTFGHHFPTFLRAYGDHELFQRFRWRFLLAPPLLFGAAMWFNSRDLHGLLLFVAAWDIWHVLMQHYGFMRIYDSKAGAIAKLTSWLDWAFAISWYITLIAASPHYSHNMLSRAYQSGLPLLEPGLVSGVRTTLWVVTALISLAYVGYHMNLWRLGRPVSFKKLILMGIFLGATYYLYVVIDDFLVGFTVWSAFHCIQYYGIVWVFNRNRVERRGAVTSFVKFLFRPHWGLALLYTALIFGYGSINLLPNYIGSETLGRTLLALIFASNALHYYYDGFIWKMREPETREGLEISLAKDPSRTKLDAAKAHVHSAVRAMRSARTGMIQAGYLAAIVIVLAMFELNTPDRELSAMESLAAAVPDVGEAHYNLGNALWRQGRHAEAIAEYSQAAERMPKSSKVFNNWGGVLAETGDFAGAVEKYEQALVLRDAVDTAAESTSRSPLIPGSAHSRDASLSTIHANLGDALARSGKSEQALEHYQAALAAGAQSAKIHAGIGATLGDLGRFDEGVRELEAALALEPAYATAHINLASLLAYLGETERARRHYQFAFDNGDARLRAAAQAAMQQLLDSP
ncbi:MAG TPA: tetratricopeptide repeat protein [Bryobacterales bacterium]|nr:tetratricopeptide repeat protein [Bryobacterales bacterium]